MHNLVLMQLFVTCHNHRWELLDFAELKWISISFFDIKKHQAAISRWSRGKKKAGRVGKGLSSDDNAQKLVDKHWLEAVCQIYASDNCSSRFTLTEY